MLWFLAASLLAAAGMGQETDLPIPFSPKQYVCYRAGTPLKIDGKLDDPLWQKAEWNDDFLDIEGPQKRKPRFRTRAKMLWDDQYFYFE